MSNITDGGTISSARHWTYHPQCETRWWLHHAVRKPSLKSDWVWTILQKRTGNNPNLWIRIEGGGGAAQVSTENQINYIWFPQHILPSAVATVDQHLCVTPQKKRTSVFLKFTGALHLKQECPNLWAHGPKSISQKDWRAKKKCSCTYPVTN